MILMLRVVFLSNSLKIKHSKMIHIQKIGNFNNKEYMKVASESAVNMRSPIFTLDVKTQLDFNVLRHL